MTCKKLLTGILQGTLLGSILVVAPVSADAFMFLPDAKKGVPSMHHDRKTNRTELDQNLTDQVERMLEPYSGVSADAEKGIVTLTGIVDSPQERENIIQRTRSVPGVNEVWSELVIHNRQIME